MIGQFFAHIGPDPRASDGSRMLIKTGVVKSQIGADRWLLEFNAKGYNFSNVLTAAQLESFVFFNTQAIREQFIAELIASNAPAPVTEAPPASVEAP
jgi:hypothetical protein